MSPLSKNFVNEIANDEIDIDNEIFKQDFGHLNPSFLAKNLLKTNQANFKPGKLCINKKELPANENYDKTVNIFENILDFLSYKKV